MHAFGTEDDCSFVGHWLKEHQAFSDVMIQEVELSCWKTYLIEVVQLWFCEIRDIDKPSNFDDLVPR